VDWIHLVQKLNITVFWDTASIRFIVLMMKTVSIFETSVNFLQTARRSIPEESHLHTRCLENLKSDQDLRCYYK
jgi:hypothetical protein